VINYLQIQEMFLLLRKSEADLGYSDEDVADF
jgi:hypothetical protein